MGLAAYFLGWRARDFLDATPHEFFAAYEVILEAHSTPEED